MLNTNVYLKKWTYSRNHLLLDPRLYKTNIVFRINDLFEIFDVIAVRLNNF